MLKKAGGLHKFMGWKKSLLTVLLYTINANIKAVMIFLNDVCTVFNIIVTYE